LRAPSTAAAASPRAASSSSSAPPLAVGDEVEVACTALAFGGRGVCRLESGFVLLCDRATPGETVVARVTGVKKGGRFAEAAKVRTSVPSPHAVESPCPHFEKCGGCTWQDVSYAAQLDMKREQVLDVLRRTAKVSPRDVVSPSAPKNESESVSYEDDLSSRAPLDSSLLDALVPPTLPAPSTARYRNKMEFAFAPSLKKNEKENVAAPRLGLRPPGDHSAVVEVTSFDAAEPGCLLQHPLANAVVASVQAHLKTHEGAAAELPAFDRKTGVGVLRSVTVRVSSVEVSETALEEDGTAANVFVHPEVGSVPAIAAVNVAACVSSDPEGATAALLALAESIARVPGVRSVTHTAVAAEPELRLAEGRSQGWVRGGRGERGGKKGNKNASGAKRSAGFAAGGIAADDEESSECGDVTVLHGASTLRMNSGA
jgi:predicted RNA-binding protein with TRAM domain